MAGVIVKGLEELADPSKFTEALNLDGLSPEVLLRQLRMMLLIRLVEECLAALIEAKTVVCPCHLGIGQEAVATGISEHLTGSDRVFGGHRSHSHYLAMGGDAHALLAETLGKETGCSKGMGGSMHLYDGPNGFHGSVPIVAATIPIAVGAGLAAKMDGRGAVAVSYFGDGAAEEGVLHESLNFASKFQLPVLFVCENNLYSSHLDISLRQPSDRVARFAGAHLIPAKVIDGNDVVKVSRAAEELIQRAREGAGPGFLETVTYRWRGHVGPSEDIDVGLRRSISDLRAWKKRDPIRRLADGMIAAGCLEQEGFEELSREVGEFVGAAKEKALNDPYPKPQALMDLVYKRN